MECTIFQYNWAIKEVVWGVGVGGGWGMVDEALPLVPVIIVNTIIIVTAAIDNISSLYKAFTAEGNILLVVKLDKSHQIKTYQKLSMPED